MYLFVFGGWSSVHGLSRVSRRSRFSYFRSGVTRFSLLLGEYSILGVVYGIVSDDVVCMVSIVRLDEAVRTACRRGHATLTGKS